MTVTEESNLIRHKTKIKDNDFTSSCCWTSSLACLALSMQNNFARTTKDQKCDLKTVYLTLAFLIVAFPGGAIGS